MTSDDSRVIESLASTTQVAAAERVARSLDTGFGLCDEAGCPLSERQRISLLTAALLGFDGFEVETRGQLGVERLIASLGQPDARG